MVNFIDIVVVLVNMVIIVDVFNRDGVWKWLLLPTLGLHVMAACLYQWPYPVRPYDSRTITMTLTMTMTVTMTTRAQ